MDTSETYIKMCEKAVEIQKLRLREGMKSDWADGDFCYMARDDRSMDHLYYRGVHIVWNDLLPCAGYHDYDSYWPNVPEDAIWLPRQDQLQEISNWNLWELNWRYAAWLFDIGEDGLCDFHVNHQNIQFTSMEQLWLAFVMKEKYNKIWNGDEWIDKRVTKQDSRGKT